MEAVTSDIVWRIDALVRGRVQSVGFRYFVRTAARRLDVTGWIRNEPDGTVRVVAEGQSDKLRHLLHALHTGPSLASVKSVDVTWLEQAPECADFSIHF